MDEHLFTKHLVKSNRILYTPSIFAKTNLIHLQEAGELTALQPHLSSREHLNSYLFFLVLFGTGTIQYERQTVPLKQGDCVFVDCRTSYSHCSSAENLWRLQWVHFFGPNMDSIYEKYVSRGGSFHFAARNPTVYATLLQEIFDMARSDDPVRDMKLYEKLVRLLTLAMEEEKRYADPLSSQNTARGKLAPVKEYLDAHYLEALHLDALADQFFINKYYLSRIFKAQYGTSINNYLIHKRVTKAKQLLRFSNESIEAVSHLCGVGDPAYFSRMFKKVEGITPGEYRKVWSKRANSIAIQ